LKENVLVIGGAGFIGSNLCEELIKNYNVVVIDNLYLGDRRNIKHLEKKGLRFIKRSYEDYLYIRNLMVNEGIKYVFHLGGYSSAPHFDDNEVRGLEVSVVAYAHLLKSCYFAKVKRLIYASTSSIYVSDGKTKSSESEKPIINSMYSASKYFMEVLSKIFYLIYGIESIGFRFFSVYGKNDQRKGKYANLITQFSMAIRTNQEFLVYGDGSQTRDFTYVKDIVSGLIAGIKKKDCGAQIYNLGTEKSYSINEMIKKLEVLWNKKAKIKYVDNPIKNYVHHTLSDIIKTKNYLGWQPQYSLDEGLQDYYFTKKVDEVKKAYG